MYWNFIPWQATKRGRPTSVWTAKSWQYMLHELYSPVSLPHSLTKRLLLFWDCNTWWLRFMYGIIGMQLSVLSIEFYNYCLGAYVKFQHECHDSHPGKCRRLVEVYAKLQKEMKGTEIVRPQNLKVTINWLIQKFHACALFTLSRMRLVTWLHSFPAIHRRMLKSYLHSYLMDCMKAWTWSKKRSMSAWPSKMQARWPMR